MSDSERPDLAAFEELQHFIRVLGDEMAAWRRRAHEAEARLKELDTALAQAATPVTMGVVPSFIEETAGAGIDSTFTGDWKYIVGGGVATFDCNADGFPDMLLAGGEHPAKFYLNQSPRGGALKFKEQPSGLELTQVVGAYPIDIDSDGIMDLVLLRSGESIAMHGLGGCKFERANEKWHFTGGDLWWTAFSATWEHGASWPTLAMGSYISITHSIDIDPWGSSPLARGAHDLQELGEPVDGLIPARAGSTPGGSLVGRVEGGSSPLARGAPTAPAGPTRPSRAHPRSRGEH